MAGIHESPVGEAVERSRQSGGDLLDAIIQSVERGSTEPILRTIAAQGPEPAELTGTPHPSKLAPVDGASPKEELYGRASPQQHSSAEQNATDGHWVTINHRHVFIQEGTRANADRRGRIASIAEKSEGDTSMPYTLGHPTCNLFVGKVIRKSGAPNPLVKKADGTMGCPSAAEWAGSPVPGWRF